MIKGAQKKMIVVRTADSSIFEEAYFVMRSGKCREECDMIDEANRIIDESGAGRRERRKRDSSRTLIVSLCSFMGGSVIGAAITLIAMLIAA